MQFVSEREQGGGLYAHADSSGAEIATLRSHTEGRGKKDVQGSQRAAVTVSLVHEPVRWQLQSNSKGRQQVTRKHLHLLYDNDSIVNKAT